MHVKPYIKEYVADVISGKKSIDTFDEFVKEWNDFRVEKKSQSMQMKY